MALDAYPLVIRSDASAFITFRGPPNTQLTWVLTGSGTLTQADAYSDQYGLAKAVFTPSTDNQQVTVEVQYVT